MNEPERKKYRSRLRSFYTWFGWFGCIACNPLARASSLSSATDRPLGFPSVSDTEAHVKIAARHVSVSNSFHWLTRLVVAEFQGRSRKIGRGRYEERQPSQVDKIRAFRWSQGFEGI